MNSDERNALNSFYEISQLTQDSNRRVSEMAFKVLAQFLTDSECPSDGWAVYDALRIANTHTHRVSNSNYGEYEIEGIQKRFAEHVAEAIPGARIVPFKRREVIPDFMVSLPDGSLCPVEVKRHHAGRRALFQILDYIEVFGAEHGFLVAPKLSVKLPPNVTFVPFE